jgi:hypothetical protein
MLVEAGFQTEPPTGGAAPETNGRQQVMPYLRLLEIPDYKVTECTLPM